MLRTMGRTTFFLSLLTPLVLSGCLTGDSVDEPSNLGGGGGGGGGSGNSAPTISGSPASSVGVANNYAFVPNANDADGDSLTFSVSNLPSWANFNASDGSLAGTPAAGDEGTYANIQISVSDGTASASLPTFSITVQAQQSGTGSVTLSWTAPTQNIDGSNLNDLSGYRIYFGTQQGVYTNEVVIANPGLSTFVVDNLQPNTYYFVATAFNSQDVESQFSNEATFVVN